MPTRALEPVWKWAGISVVVLLLAGGIYGRFFSQLFETWRSDEEYSFGILIPVLVGYLLFRRRGEIAAASRGVSWAPGLLLVAIGSGLQILATRSGALLLSGVALILMMVGTAGYLWGKREMGVVAWPMALLLLMVPLPSYAMGEITWHLQSYASTISASVLSFVGIPVYQDGNLLRLPNYVLEVKQACSGSHSMVALLALACGIGSTVTGRWWARAGLVIVAPVLAVGANIVRIVGTGLIARQWGSLAANESLHEAWGIAAFLMAVCGLLAVQSLMRGASCKNA